MKETIRQLRHKTTNQMFDLDMYDTMAIRQFCRHMAESLPEDDEVRKLYLDKLEKMTHLEILAHLDEQGFECIEILVTRKEEDNERAEWEKKNLDKDQG